MGGGYCMNLKHFVKKNLNDPDSFEHVETNTYDNGNDVIVKMMYRTKNVFGTKIIKSVKARVSWDCEVMEIIESK